MKLDLTDYVKFGHSFAIFIKIKILSVSKCVASLTFCASKINYYPLYASNFNHFLCFKILCAKTYSLSANFLCSKIAKTTHQSPEFLLYSPNLRCYGKQLSTPSLSSTKICIQSPIQIRIRRSIRALFRTWVFKKISLNKNFSFCAPK